jgi:hypothetical protein
MSTPSVAPPPIEPPKSIRWHRRLLSICLIVFAFEIGIFLIVFPWHPAWSMSWIPVHSKTFAPLWMSPYFRGLVSGLGLLDLYVALAEAVKQIKSLFAERIR